MSKNLSNETMIHQKGEEIEYLQFRRLLAYPELVHAYTLRASGFGMARIGIKEQKEQRKYDQERLAKTFGISKHYIIRPDQQHTDVVAWVEQEQKGIHQEFTNVDGLLSAKTKAMLCLTYADCTPILLYDPVENIIGNIHSGWKGTLKGIGKKAVSQMIEKGHCHPENIICCLGPHIHQCHFEVGEEVAKAFAKQYQHIENIHEIIIKTKKQEQESKFYIDTTAINVYLMKQMGLKQENIIDSGICTVCHQAQMHSYRAGKEQAGRNIAIMGRMP